MEGQWCTIESDPNTFRELANKLGVLDVQFEEIFDLDSASNLLASFSSSSSSNTTTTAVYGFVFLFKWTGAEGEGELIDKDSPLFIKQNVTNSCATISILHIALNTPQISISEELRRFKEFVEELPADMRGLALTNSEHIRQAHNGFISPGSINADPDEGAEKGDAFHFVSIIPGLFLMDGMRDGPLKIGNHHQPSSPPSSFIDTTIQYIKNIMNNASNEIRFSLLAMIPDQLKLLNEQLLNCTDQSVKAELKRLIKVESDKRSNVASNQNGLSPEDQNKLKTALELMAKVKANANVQNQQ